VSDSSGYGHDGLGLGVGTAGYMLPEQSGNSWILPHPAQWTVAPDRCASTPPGALQNGPCAGPGWFPKHALHGPAVVPPTNSARSASDISRNPAFGGADDTAAAGGGTVRVVAFDIRSPRNRTGRRNAEPGIPLTGPGPPPRCGDNALSFPVTMPCHFITGNDARNAFSAAAARTARAVAAPPSAI